ncbi:O-sialoglycoprotein_endopeptidase [Hexamita inflata]|uniref:18S rRNA aminocarboxypropyltransferase n=1 Tax=Hexamita inflata TaxID=28002 RepID=A0ABP1HC01_9EUKA
MPVKLVMYDFKQCDPKRCSGQRLAARGLIKTILKSQPFTGVLLSSEGTSYFSVADVPQINQSGLGVVDCSWNEILRHDSVPIKQLKCKTHRLLPFLIAANAVNYGKPMHLNCAEAVIAGLYIMGAVDQALELAEVISYGGQFIKLNQEYLDLYKECADSAEIVKVQEGIIARLGDKEEKVELMEELEEEEEIDYNAIYNKIQEEKQ